jgi:low temperature requirement protein LtrA
VLLYLRAWRALPDARPLTGRYAVGFGLAALVWLASAFVPPPYRLASGGSSASPSSSTSRSRRARGASSTSCRRTAHFAERYGLFTIIVLGESFIKVVGGLSRPGLTPRRPGR